MIIAFFFVLMGLSNTQAATSTKAEEQAAAELQVDLKSAGAVCEKATAQVILKADGTVRSKNSLEFKIQTEEGRTHYGLREVPFTPEVSKIENLSAFSQNGGELSITAKKDMVERSESADKVGLHNQKKIIIPFNNVKVGSTLVYRYDEVATKPLLPNLAFLSAKFGDEFPELNSLLEITSPKPLHFTVLDNDKSLEITEAKTNGLYSLKIKNTRALYKIPELKTLSLVPSGVLPMVFISTAGSWNEVIKPLSEKYEAAINSPLPEAFAKIVREASAKTTDLEKIRHASTAVSKLIAYSGNWTTQAGMYFPRGHQAVVAEAKGDCKDFAVSVAAILRKLGFDASVALVMSSNPAVRILKDLDVKTLVPSPEYFNHAVVRVKRPNGVDLWIDATNPVAYVEGIWPSIAGSPAMVLISTKNDLERVPEDSAEISKLTLTRQVKGETLDQADWQGSFKADGLFAAELIQERTLHGAEKLDAALPNYLLRQMVSPGSKIHLGTEALPTVGSELKFEFKTLGKNPVAEDKDKNSQLTIDMDESIATVFRANEKTGSYLGPLSIIETNTTYQNTWIKDPVLADCYILSDWMDLERTVSSTPAGAVIRSVLRIKKSYVTAAEAKGKEFGYFATDLVACLRDSQIKAEKVLPVAITKPKSADAKVNIHDLPLEPSSMEAAVLLLRSNSGLESQYTDLKTKRIFDIVLEATPGNLRARTLRAKSIQSHGYLVGREYKKSYTDLALKEYTAILTEDPKQDLARYYRSNLYSDVLNRQEEAMNDAVAAYSLDSNSARNRTLMANVYLNKKDFKLAQSWLAAAKPLAKTNLELSQYWEARSTLASRQNDNKSHLEAETELAKLDPGSPWVWHNLAIALYYDDQLEKAAESERKGLAIMPFGAGRHHLSIILNAMALKSLKPDEFKKGAVDPKVEQSLLEAQKLDPTNIDTLSLLTSIYLARVQLTKESDWIDKAQITFDEAEKIDPKDKNVLRNQKLLKEVKTKLIAYFRQRGVKPSGRWPAEFDGK